MRGAVYCIVVANGGIDAFNQILVLFRKEELHEEKERLSRSLGASKDVDVLQKVTNVEHFLAVVFGHPLSPYLSNDQYL